jgi:hypothetical protein
MIYKLINFNFPMPLIMIVDSFLNNRTARVMIGGQTSDSFRIPYGLPQGAVLSPSLYNLYTSDIPMGRDHLTALFADDMAMLKSSKIASAIDNGLKKAARVTNRYMDRWKIKINGGKTQAMFITRRRTKQLPPRTINIFGAKVEWTRAVKYLGVVIDKGLTFKEHIDYVTQRANNAIRVLYSLLNRNSKLDVDNKLLIYKLAIRPILTYGLPALKGIAPTQIKRLQVIQNKSIKMALGRAWYTRTEEIHRKSKIPLMADYIDRITAKFDSNYN